MRFNPDIHHRRSIRLKNYDYSSNGMYFVTICAQNREMLFRRIVGAALRGRPDDDSNRIDKADGRPDDDDNGFASPDQMITKWLMETENKFLGVRIDKFVVMPNHIHFIVDLQGGHVGPPLPEIVEWFKTMTTNEFIRKVKSGLYPPFDRRIWQRDYFEHIIRDEADYQRIWKYIDDNPARWEEDRYYMADVLNKS